MSQTSDQMELREEDIAKHIAMAQSLIEGFDTHREGGGCARHGTLQRD